MCTQHNLATLPTLNACLHACMPACLPACYDTAGLPRSLQLLEFSVREGWEPLCEFLGVPVPDEPFPRINSTEEMTNRIKRSVCFLALTTAPSCFACIYANVDLINKINKYFVCVHDTMCELKVYVVYFLHLLLSKFLSARNGPMLSIVSAPAPCHVQTLVVFQVLYFSGIDC